MKATPIPSARTRARLKRNDALYRRFLELYEHRRLRLDDVTRRLAAEFFLTERTVLRILRQQPPTAPRQSPSHSSPGSHGGAE
ncbi:MAG: hypothetical protein SFY70_10230 [Bacteroidia bacterium]|nr:hypothetical protein [Bacteroidia bacterium]